jgi:hypothetical protein
MTTQNNTLSFARDIRPLFRESDRDAMEFAFDLWNYDDVRASAREIFDRLADGSMPCDEVWPDEQIDLFGRWIEAGMPA